MITRKSLLVIFLVSYTASIQAQTNVSGEITTNTTWGLSGTPYMLTGAVTVRSGATLTIESGATVNGQTYNTLRIGDTYGTAGILQASGVTFSSGNVEFQNSSSGTISNSTFAGTTLRFYDQSAPTISGNTFDVNSPLYVHSQEVVL